MSQELIDQWKKLLEPITSKEEKRTALLKAVLQVCDEEKLEYLLALSSAEGDDANYVVVGMSGHMPFLAGIIEDVLRRVNIEDCVHLAGIASATVLRRMFEGKEKPDATDEEPGL